MANRLVIPPRDLEPITPIKGKITFVFDDADYIATHGKAPRGFGSWVFDYQGTRRNPQPVFAPSSTITEAKRWIREYIKERAPDGYTGDITIRVCT